MAGKVELPLTQVRYPESTASVWRQISSSLLDILSFLCALDLQQEMESRELDTGVCSSMERADLKTYNFKS